MHRRNSSLSPRSSRRASSSNSSVHDDDDDNNTESLSSSFSHKMKRFINLFVFSMVLFLSVCAIVTDTRFMQEMLGSKEFLASSSYDSWDETSGSNKSNSQYYVRSRRTSDGPAITGESVFDDNSNQRKGNLVSIDPDYLQHLKELDPIPHKIHIFFPEKSILEDDKNMEFPMIQYGIGNLKKQNPDWEIFVYDDKDVDEIIQTIALEWMSQEERDLLRDAHIMERVDLARLIVMYTQGGVSVDVDRVVNIPLQDVLQTKKNDDDERTTTAKLCLPTLYDVNFMPDIMCSSPQNRLYRSIMEEQSKIRMTGGGGGGDSDEEEEDGDFVLPRRGGWVSRDDMARLGLETYSRVISKVVFGRKHNSLENDEEKMQAAREAILEQSEGTILTKKDEWCDGFLVTPFEGCKRIQNTGLFHKFGIDHWDKDIRERWEKKGEEKQEKYSKKGVKKTKTEAKSKSATKTKSTAAAAAAKSSSSSTTTTTAAASSSSKEEHQENNDQDNSSSINRNKILLDPSYVEYLTTLDPMPHKLHILFPHKTIVDHPEIPMVKYGLLNMINLNPDWEVTIYEDKDVDRIIRETDLISQEEKDVLLGSGGSGSGSGGAHIVEKTDLARLIIMYTEGGMYVDIDRVANIPFDQIFKENSKMCLPTTYDVNFQQDLMCSSAKNKLYQQVIQEQTRYRMTGGKDGTKLPRVDGWTRSIDLFTMGPHTYNKVLSKVAFGRDDFEFEEGEQVATARESVANTDGVIVTKKDQWCDGFLVKPFKGCKAVSKADLFRFFGMGQWEDVVNARWEKEDGKKEKAV